MLTPRPYQIEGRDYWRRYYDRQVQVALVAIMRACRVDQIYVSHADLTKPAEVVVEDTPEGGKFFRIKDTFKLC